MHFRFLSLFFMSIGNILSLRIFCAAIFLCVISIFIYLVIPCPLVSLSLVIEGSYNLVALPDFVHNYDVHNKDTKEW